MNLPLAIGWGLLGLVAGFVLNLVSRWLAGVEEIEHRPSRREELVAPALAAILFAVFAGKLGFQPVLLIDTVYIAILVQVFAFDLKHRLILDAVMFPSWVIAIGLAFITPWSQASWPAADWRTALVAGVLAGGIFLVLSVGGAFLVGPDAFGLGGAQLAGLIWLA